MKVVSLALFGALCAFAQNMGSSGSVSGTVTDPTGLPVPGAQVHILNRVTGFDRTAQTDRQGTFRFTNLVPHNYHFEVKAAGFDEVVDDVTIRPSVPVLKNVVLKVGQAVTSVDVHADTDLVENIPTPHTVVDTSQFEKLPVYTVGGALNNVIAHSAPGIVEDSNGFIHPQGDHAQTQYVFDNQPVTDQQSKQFSTSMPENAIASVEVIAGAPPAEYGDKTSLVVNAITRSGLGVTKPFGSFNASYGSFGTIGEEFTFGTGGKKWGQFLSANTVRSGRYLDPPEFSSLHNVGNNQTIFDRLDYQPNERDTLRLNLFFSRAWFQTPNTYEQAFSGQDQRQRVISFNIAPGYVHLFNANSTLTVNPYIRQDQLVYTPSRDRLDDHPATVAQTRRLTNLGLKTDYAWVNQHHNIKAGIQLQNTFLTERFSFGITDPNYVEENDVPGLAPYDLTKGGTLFRFNGHTAVKEYSFYVQDAITLGNLTVQAGIRGDIYRGLVGANSAQPRIGLSYQIKGTNTVLRASYSKFFETPYNENLILSSSTGSGGLAANVFGAFGQSPLRPGTRDQYNLGLQQGIGRHLVVDGGYFFKRTSNAYDFDTLFNTPIFFPIAWRKSKIDGISARVSLTPIHGFSAYWIPGHTRARFFGPENGGLLFNSPLSTDVFRIDHDQAYQHTAHFRYAPGKNGFWTALTWRYASGAVAGGVSDLASAFELSGNEQAMMRFRCGSVYATLDSPITSCAGEAKADLVRIPTGEPNDDHNPARMAPRSIVDLAIGHDNLFHGEKRRYHAQLTVVNVANKAGLYNFLSTFSGTHFISPRAVTAQVGVVW